MVIDCLVRVSRRRDGKRGLGDSENDRTIVKLCALDSLRGKGIHKVSDLKKMSLKAYARSKPFKLFPHTAIISSGSEHFAKLAQTLK